MIRFKAQDGTRQVEETIACPKCGFAFSSLHTIESSGDDTEYSCPECENVALIAILSEIRVIVNTRLSPSPSVLKLAGILRSALAGYEGTLDALAKMRWQDDQERLMTALRIPGVVGFGSDSDQDGEVSVYYKRDEPGVMAISRALAEAAAKPLTALHKVAR